MGEEERGNQGNSVRERGRGSTGLVFHDCAPMAGMRGEREGERTKKVIEISFLGVAG